MDASEGRRTALDHFVDMTERMAAMFLAAISLLTFISILLRAFSYAVPDWYDISRLMLGVTIFWGIASTSYRGDHIKVDILWEWASPFWRRAIDIFATLVTMIFLALFAYMLFFKVQSGWRSGEATFDVRMPIWPFHALAAVGIAFAVILIAIRLFRLFRADESELRS